MKIFGITLILSVCVLSITTTAQQTQQTGNITYTLHKESNPTQDQKDAYAKITAALDSALSYYNKYTTLTKALNIYYNTNVTTADASFNGTIRFGSERSYMVVHTAMHEIAHTLGIGTTSEYRNLMQNGIFTGTKATAMLKEVTNNRDTVLKGDNQHFWPYGLNYASEVKSSQDLIDHCKIVDAMCKDMFQEELYRICRLRSKSTGSCMDVADGKLILGACDNQSSVVKLVRLNGESIFRLEFGNKVLDIPNESRSAGVAASVYNWNGGGHQRAIFEFKSAEGLNDVALIKMSHSNLYLRADKEKIIQDHSSTSDQSFYWELIGDQVANKPLSSRKINPENHFRISNDQMLISHQFPENKAVSARILDFHGRIVKEVKLSGNRNIFNINNMAKGVYIFDLNSEMMAFREKFIIK